MTLTKKALPTARDRYIYFAETHAYLPWAYALATHPNVLDAVESLLGPDLLIWDSRWFTKRPGDGTYVSWHQDGTYWALDPPKVSTAWISLARSFPGNGAMQVVPGSHTGACTSRAFTTPLPSNRSSAVSCLSRQGRPAWWLSTMGR